MMYTQFNELTKGELKMGIAPKIKWEDYSETTTERKEV